MHNDLVYYWKTFYKKTRKYDEICRDKTWRTIKKWKTFLKLVSQNQLKYMGFEPGKKMLLTSVTDYKKNQ